jgi:hypothetical protein
VKRIDFAACCRTIVFWLILWWSAVSLHCPFKELVHRVLNAIARHWHRCMA